MSDKIVAQALKDEDVRENLTEEQKAAMPQNPAGDGEATADELDETAGGTTPVLTTAIFVTVAVDSALTSVIVSRTAAGHC